jgi:hypothetical protein
MGPALGRKLLRFCAAQVKEIHSRLYSTRDSTLAASPFPFFAAALLIAGFVFAPRFAFEGVGRMLL